MLVKGIIYDGVALAEKFNEHFLEAGKYAGSIPLPNNTSLTSCIQISNYDSIFLTPTTEAEITTIINSLKNTCAPGDDDISPLPIKNSISCLIEPLTYIFNQMLATGVFPDRLKIARVTVVFKGGNKTEFGNYRPISVLPIFSKVAEKIIYTRFFGFLSQIM